MRGENSQFGGKVKETKLDKKKNIETDFPFLSELLWKQAKQKRKYFNLNRAASLIILLLF